MISRYPCIGNLASLALLLCLTASQPAAAQIKDTAVEDSLVTYGNSQVVRYRVGASITANRGPVQDVLAMVAVPFECAEQQVQIAEEDISPEVDQLDYRLLDGGARQMLIRIPYLPNGKEAHAIITFDVTTSAVLPPEEDQTALLVVPQKPDRQLKKYLGRSDYIQTTDSKIRKTLREIFAPKKQPAEASESEPASDEPDGEAASAAVDAGPEQSADDEETLTPWQRVETIYDYVQDNVQYVEGDDKTAVETLTDGTGDCHDISALFVALCRADKVPARLVWVHEHCYAEFCLADADGDLHWFPCESSGTRGQTAGVRAFGAMPQPRVIMQKGDNFRVPERPRERLRYATDFFIGVPVRGSGKPLMKYIREQL
ncbi:transglutaminase-like domain-containing protein [Bythopirellula polymerisocia]|uniref:Transglutaminase-like superfamily protein n=1 Tax=Bythopirellula polymerisocia TaxID=2528003 RepID=A0A5C6CTM5_9BACT|nr:transglutaminase-like domain-containing protein [Bythopirellula polymerisocia]TWU28293.1 Transglutaminase-like superfamily protein [Bythopirellula polymerisocia]